MNTIKTIPTLDELVGALDAMDVPFLTGGKQTEIALALSPAELIEGLAQAPEARMRSALIPLLLRHPEFATNARSASTQLEGQSLYTLQLFYTAGMLLQKKYAARLENLFGVQADLPDLFSETVELELDEDIEKGLVRVGVRHAELRGLKMNWAGGYEHAARSWLEYVELRAKRTKQRLWRTH